MSVICPDKRTAVNQPPSGGDDYPFVAESALKCLVSDAYLSHDDFDCSLVGPFRIDWLYGFGTQAAAPPAGTPTPTHARDVRVVDAVGSTVFDSTQAGTFAETAWGQRRVCEWHTDRGVCRLVVNSSQFPDYADHEAPADAVLDARTHNRRPDGLRSLRVGLLRVQGQVVLEAGYNVTLVDTVPDQVDGGRRTTVVTVAAEAGSGQGRQPGCAESLPLAVRRINGQTADASGNFFLDFDPCIRRQLAVVVAGGTATHGGYGLAAERAAAAIVMDSDCLPCCPCEYFVRTYKALQRLQDRFLGIAQDAEAVRDQYHANRDRWLTQQDCRQANNVTLLVDSEPGCLFTVRAAYCNTTKSCLAPVELRFIFQVYEDGVPVPPAAENANCQQAFIGGGPYEFEEPFAMPPAWPTLLVNYPYLDPQSTATIRFRKCAVGTPQGCTDKTAVEVTLSVHFPDPPPDADGNPVDVPNLGDGAPYGSAYPVRAVLTVVRPLDPVRVTLRCDCTTF